MFIRSDSCRPFGLMKVLGVVAGILFAGLSDQALAGGDRAYGMNSEVAGKHQSIIHVPETGGISFKRDVRIGLGKSVLIEFPREVRDVLVSNPAAVDAVVLSSNRVFLLARSIGESNAFFFDVDGNQFATFELFVQRETAGLESLLARLIPGSNIKVEMLNQSVVLTGSVRNPSDASRAASIASQFANVNFKVTAAVENEGATAIPGASSTTGSVINMLTVEAGEQVMLKVTVAEVQRSMMKQFGINIGASINAGNFATTLLTANALPLTSAAGLGSLPLPGVNTTGDAAGALSLFNEGPTAAGDPFGNSGTAGFWGTGNQSIAHTIRALERNGLVKTLAEPTLTAVSGESAKFLAGGEFPIPAVNSEGEVSVTFREFGVGLAFTPVVLSEGRISIKIDTEVSELTSAGAVTLNFIQIPALQTRKASSTVEMPSGGSLAIAGLLSEDTRQNIDGLPGLKDLPVLGTLFRSRDYISEETELVIIVTPYIVRPTAAAKLGKPTDGLVSATDAKANFLGHINRIYGRKESPVSDASLKGDYGFIVE